MRERVWFQIPLAAEEQTVIGEEDWPSYVVVLLHAENITTASRQCYVGL